MKYKTLILFLIIYNTTFSQRIEGIKGDYSLEICMKPSFIEQANFTIKKNNELEDSYIHFKNSYFDNKQSLDLNSLKALEEFLETYQFENTNNIRTENVIKDGDTSTFTIVGFDDITVSGKLTRLNDYKEFTFWSPEKNSKNYELVKLIFSITDQNFVDERERKYLNSLKGYFKDLSSKNLQDSSHIEFRTKKDVHMIVEKMPSFIGGKDSLNMYLSRKIEAAPIIKSSKKEGKVFVEFLIDEDGGVKNVTILKGLDERINNECLRIISEMQNWKAGEHYGEKVKVSYRIPIKIDKNN